MNGVFNFKTLTKVINYYVTHIMCIFTHKWVDQLIYKPNNTCPENKKQTDKYHKITANKTLTSALYKL